MSTSSSNNHSSTSIPYRASRWPARLLMWTGIGHNMAGLIRPIFREPLVAAIRQGYVAQFDFQSRGNSFWFFLTGFNLYLLGKVVDWYLFPVPASLPSASSSAQPEKTKTIVVDTRERSERLLPLEFGTWCLGLGIGGALAFPTSGCYLMIIQGLLIYLKK